MLFENENCIKKMDNVGRIVIPKSIRYKAGIAEGADVEFFYMETSGKKYVCLTPSVEEREADRYEEAAKVLEELGEPIPESLSSLLEEKGG